MTTFLDLLRTEIAAHAVTMRTFLIIAMIVVGANLVMGGGGVAALVCTMTVAFLPGNLGRLGHRRAHHRQIGQCRRTPRRRRAR